VRITQATFLYTKGVLAVIDISKFFHMFSTVPSERKYMGLVHPKMGEHDCMQEHVPWGPVTPQGPLGTLVMPL
jgi:hypothetical protein